MGNNNENETVKNAHQQNNLGKKLFVFSMIFVVVFFIYITFFHPHSSPDYVKELREDAATESQSPPPASPAVSADEPWVSTPETIAKGEAIFKTNCAICHGPRGLGDGPAGQALNPKPRNYSEGKWKQGNSAIAIFNTITKGIPNSSMAAFETAIPEGDRWVIVHYVKTIGKNIVDPSPAEIKAFKEKKK